MDSLIQNTLLLAAVGVGLAIFVVALVGIATAIIVKHMPAPVEPRVEPVPVKELVAEPVAQAAAPAPVAAPAAPVAEAAPAKPAEEPKEIDRRTLAVISAAIAAVFGPGFHIRTIRQLPEYEGASWARAGRLSLQESHNIATRSTR